MKHPHFRIGLRTAKTALAVIISMLIVSSFGTLTIFPALAAIVVMSRTFDEGLQECKNQGVSILIGGVIGYFTATVFPDTSIWIMGLGILLVIGICSGFGLSFSCGLSCIIFISACLTPAEEVLFNTIIRLLHTAIGLLVGLAINYFIIPYSNSKKIYSLLNDLVFCIPTYIRARVLLQLYPDLRPLNEQIQRLHYEASIYRHQRFLRKAFHREELAYIQGCIQLAERIHHELTALCSMDCIGVPDQRNTETLADLGISLPKELHKEKADDERTSQVTNYHLETLLQARAFLIQLLTEREQFSH